MIEARHLKLPSPVGLFNLILLEGRRGLAIELDTSQPELIHLDVTASQRHLQRNLAKPRCYVIDGLGRKLLLLVQ